MSIIYFMLIAVIVIIVAALVGLWLWDHRADIKDIREVRKHYHKNDKLVIDYYRVPTVFVTDTYKNRAEPRIRWVGAETSESDLYLAGYLKAEKWMEDLRYLGVPVFVQLHNFKIIDPEKDWKKLELKKPNKMKSSTMYNVYHNQNMKKNITGLTRINFATIDLKSLAVMLPIIIGVVFGLLYVMKMI